MSYFQVSKLTSPSDLVLDAASGKVVQLSKTLDFNSNALTNGTTASFATSVTTPSFASPTGSALTLSPASGKNVIVGSGSFDLNSAPVIGAVSLTAVTGSDFTLTAASGKSIVLGSSSPLNVNSNGITGAVSLTAVTGSDFTITAASGKSIVLGSSSPLNLGSNAVSGATSITAAASTDLTLSGGSGGKSVVLSTPLNANTNAISGVTTLGVSGLISSPSGVTFTKQASNPGGTATIWVDTTTSHLFIGSTDLQGTTSLQAAYNNSTNPEIVLTAALGGLTIADNATPIGATLFEVTSNGGTNFFKVNATTSTFGTDVVISGNLNVTGTTTSVNTTNANYLDNFLYLNDGYTSTSGTSSGLAVNYKATATATTIASSVAFTPGVAATSNPTVTTVGSATFSAGDLIQIYGTVNNDGIYEVLTHVTTTLTIKGVGVTGTVESFTNTNFVAETTASVASVTKVNVSVLRASGTNGLWQNATGSATGAGLTYNYLVNGPSNQTSTDTAIPTWNGTAGSTLRNTAVLIDSSANVTGMNSLTISKSSQTTTGVKVLEFSTATASSGTPLTDIIQNAVQTTDATVTTINTFTVANSTIFGIKALVLGRNSATSDTASFTLEALFKADGAGAITQVGTTTRTVFLDSTPSSAGWDVTLASGGANTLNLRVTGAAATTIRWHSTSEIYYFTY